MAERLNEPVRTATEGLLWETCAHIAGVSLKVAGRSAKKELATKGRPARMGIVVDHMAGVLASWPPWNRLDGHVDMSHSKTIVLNLLYKR